VQPAFAAALTSLSAGQITIRFPAGTNGNYWDWKAGMNIPLANMVLSPQILLNSAATPVAGAGPAPVVSGDSLSLAQLYAAFVAPSSATNSSNMQVIWNINVMTCSSTETCSNGLPWSEDPIQYQVDMLMAAHVQGLPVQYIELGNEFFLGTTDNIHAFGNPANVNLSNSTSQKSILVVESPGYNYGNLCRIWAGEIKRRLTAAGGDYINIANNLQFAVVGDTAANSTWNFNVMQGITAPTGGGYTDPSTSTAHTYGPLTNYNLTFHPYYSGAFGSWYLIPPNPGNPYTSPSIDLTNAAVTLFNNGTPPSPINAVTQVLAQSFVQWGGHQAFTRLYPASSPASDSQYCPLDSGGTNNLTASFVPVGNKAWYTEYNLQDMNAPLHGTWVHGLFTGLQSLLMLENADTRFVAGTGIVGTGLFSAMFAASNSLQFGSLLSSPDRPAFLMGYTTMPTSQVCGFSAVGQVYSLIADAAANALRVTPLVFTGDRDPAGSPGSFVTFTYDNNQYQCAYPKLYGCSFFTYDGDPDTTSAISGKSIIINASSDVITLSYLNRALGTDGQGTITVLKQMGPGQTYGSYPQYYPGVYLTGATTGGIPIELTGTVNATVPTNNTYTIPPYSITELSWVP